MFKCKYCEESILCNDDVPNHECFIGKNVYATDDNILYTEDVSTVNDVEAETEYLDQLPTSKQHAVWTKDATLALLSLYEAKKNMLNNPKKKVQIWEAISNDLKDFGIQMSCDQVRWKFNALTKKYKECLDNNSATGRGTINFEFYDQMEEIFGRQSNAVGTHVISSTLPLKNSEASTSKKQNRLQSDSRSLPSTCSNSNSSGSSANISSRKRSRPHGSGSDAAKTKVELEKQWTLYYNKENRDSARDERYATFAETKREMVKLKKRQLALKEKELEYRKEIAANKRKEKINRHNDILEIEQQKCELLKKLIMNKKNCNLRDVSDSD